MKKEKKMLKMKALWILTGFFLRHFFIKSDDNVCMHRKFGYFSSKPNVRQNSEFCPKLIKKNKKRVVGRALILMAKHSILNVF